jgi:hypothetical protein
MTEVSSGLPNVISAWQFPVMGEMYWRNTFGNLGGPVDF